MTRKNKARTCTNCHTAATRPNQYVCDPCCKQRGYVTDAITTVCMDCGNRPPVTHHVWADGVTCLPCLALAEAQEVYGELEARKCPTCPNDGEEEYAGFCHECWWEDRPRPRTGGYRQEFSRDRTGWGDTGWGTRDHHWKPEPPAPKVPALSAEMTTHAYRAPSA